GFAATGVATILREAGVNSGSLYHFFPSKEALLEGVLEWYLERLYPEILQPMEQREPDPVSRIFVLLDWYRGFLARNDCRLGCPVGNLALEVSDTHPQLKVLIDRNFENWSGVIHRWLEEAGDALPPDADRAGLARLVLTVMEGAVMQARAAGRLEPYDQSVSQLKRYFEVLSDQARQQAAPIARMA
ncbi:MAG: TetR/AcrR family transcriptional regulator, partial [Xanthomonadales bacterium]|nr:TetR/AcrR family transcriptional regulator [Xanthomonadales bacterium]